MNNEKTERESGFINAYDAFKGFGFIRREKGKDVFFMYDQLPSDDFEPSEGDTVTFNVIKTPKGPRAEKVVKIGHADSVLIKNTP